MSTFYDNDITNKGRELLAELMSGASFKPTRIVMGQGYLPVGTTVRNITDVVSPVATMEINKSAKIPPSGEIPEGCYVIGGMFSNAEITADFYFRELGLYAKAIRQDGTETAEVLYSYGNAGDDGERIPAYSTTTVIEKQTDLITYIGNDTAVTLQVNSGITVTQAEFDETISGIDADIDALFAKFTQISADNTLNLTASGWGEDNTQTVTVSGITANMKAPLVDVMASTVEEDEEWAKIWKVETLAGKMKFYAREKPSLAMTVRYKVVM